MKNYKDRDDFINRQLKDSMVKVQGAINLLNTNAVILSRNKMWALYQKLGYILQQINNWEDNENNNDSNVSQG